MKDKLNLLNKEQIKDTIAEVFEPLNLFVTNNYYMENIDVTTKNNILKIISKAKKIPNKSPKSLFEQKLVLHEAAKYLIEIKQELEKYTR